MTHGDDAWCRLPLSPECCSRWINVGKATRVVHTACTKGRRGGRRGVPNLGRVTY